MQKAHRCRSSDTVLSFGEPDLIEKSAFWAILAVVGLILGVSGPVFSIFSPDMMQISLFDPENAKNSPVPF